MFDEAFIDGLASGLDKIAKKKKEEEKDKDKHTYGRAAGKGAMVMAPVGAGFGALMGALHEEHKIHKGKLKANKKGQATRTYKMVPKRVGSAKRAGYMLGGAAGGGLSGAAKGALFGLLAHHVTKKD